MRIKKPQLVITFSNTPEAIKMEKYCQEHQMLGRLIPIPSQITAGCGLAWKTELSEKDTIMNFMEQQKLHWEAMYELLMF